jgi:hypothetical protein
LGHKINVIFFTTWNRCCRLCGIHGCHCKHHFVVFVLLVVAYKKKRM